MTTTEHERRWAEIEQRRAKATEPFKQLCAPFLGVAVDTPVARRLRDAQWAHQEYRDAHGQDRNMGGYDLSLGVRVVADQLARDIEDAAATAGQDPATIAWVLAGLRCPRRPFCTGCGACFTVTSPLRPMGDA